MNTGRSETGARNDLPATCVVRRFESRDVQAIEAIADKSPQAAQWSHESYAALNEQAYLVWVGEVSGTLAGFLVARVASDEAEILNFAVDPGHRRAGVATALFQQAVAEFRRHNATRIFAEVRESNKTAIAFYQVHGFVRTGLRPGYYQHSAEAAVLLISKLTD
jgi:[ribosomal protein S18]-alanine N-acetyltransferase